jgi:hypothetical protein
MSKWVKKYLNITKIINLILFHYHCQHKNILSKMVYFLSKLVYFLSNMVYFLSYKMHFSYILLNHLVMIYDKKKSFIKKCIIFKMSKWVTTYKLMRFFGLVLLIFITIFTHFGRTNFFHVNIFGKISIFPGFYLEKFI